MKNKELDDHGETTKKPLDETGLMFDNLANLNDLFKNKSRPLEKLDVMIHHFNSFAFLCTAEEIKQVADLVEKIKTNGDISDLWKLDAMLYRHMHDKNLWLSKRKMSVTNKSKYIDLNITFDEEAQIELNGSEVEIESNGSTENGNDKLKRLLDDEL